MLRKLYISLFFIGCYFVFNAQEKYVQLKSSDTNKASIVWMPPQIDDKGNISVKAKIFASFPIDSKQIEVLVNDKKSGSKARIASLFGNAEHEYTFEQTFENFNNSRNEYRLVLKNESEEFQSAAVRIEGREFSFASDDDFSTRVLWMFPDPSKTEGYKIRQESSLFHFKAIIKTGVSLQSKNSLKLVLNNAIYKPKETDRLVKIGENLFEYEGSILLDRQYPENSLYITVNVNGIEEKSKPFHITINEDKPSLYVLSVGTLTNLDYTSKDAEDFAKLFQEQGVETGIFQQSEIELLTGTKAVTTEIKGRVEELKLKKDAGKIKEKDLVILFISSHGFLLGNELRIQGDDYDPSRKRSTSISFKSDIIDILKEIDCKKLVFIDACHSGGGGKSNIADLNFEIEKLNKAVKGISIIVSSQKDEQSYEDPAWQNGAFTEAIISGLRGRRADTDGNSIITINELFNYLNSEVPKLVFDVKNKPQHPKMISDELGDVAIYYIN